MKKNIYRYFKFKRIMLPINIVGLVLNVLFMVVWTIKLVQRHNPINKGIISTYLFFIVLLIIILIFIINYIESIKKYNETVEKGKKVPGTIKEIIETEDPAATDGPHIVYCLLIKYKDPNTNEEIEYKTPILGINPYRKLKSNKCNVYLYNGEILPEDFELTNNIEECYFKEPENSLTKGERIIAKVALILLFIILAIMIVSIISMAI